MRQYALHEKEIPFIRDFRALSPGDQEAITQIVRTLIIQTAAANSEHVLHGNNVVTLPPRPALL